MIIEVKANTRLKLELDGGMVNNKAVKKSKTFNNLNPEALNEDIYQIGKSISGLQSLELLELKKLEETILIEE